MRRTGKGMVPCLLTANGQDTPTHSKHRRIMHRRLTASHVASIRKPLAAWLDLTGGLIAGDLRHRIE